MNLNVSMKTLWQTTSSLPPLKGGSDGKEKKTIRI